MKSRLFALFLGCLALALSANAQTLADRARELRKDKRTPSANEKVFTNETLNLRPAPSISEKTENGKDAKKDAADAEGDEEKTLTPDEEKAKTAADYKDKIEKAKGELATVQRELDIAQRENRLRVAQYYSDAGNKLRDEKKFADEERRNQADIADKQKKLADTQATIERLRSEARRAGVPPGLIP
jgi:hypothetical protein